jgi:hypothetical protein
MDGPELGEVQWRPTAERPYPTLTPEQRQRAEEILAHRFDGYTWPEPEQDQ